MERIEKEKWILSYYAICPGNSQDLGLKVTD
jgi:hypothetical protein